MRIRELIERLQKYDPDLEIFMIDHHGDRHDPAVWDLDAVDSETRDGIPMTFERLAEVMPNTEEPGLVVDGRVRPNRVKFVGMYTWEVGESTGRFTATNGHTATIFSEDDEYIHLRFDDPGFFLADYSGGCASLPRAHSGLIVPVGGE